MSAVETWRPVPGYAGTYEVSDAGRVRRATPGRGARAGHVLKPAITRSGYQQVALRLEGKTRSRLVCQLVCEAFHGPRPDGMEVRHLNGRPSDDRPSNVCWGTRLENADDVRRHGTHRNSKKTHCVNGHEFTPENTAVRADSGGRSCRTCRTESSRRKKAAARARRAA